MSNKVLVADDDINLSIFWEDWLAKAGYIVTRVTTRDDALAAFTQGARDGVVYALVVLDMRMPNSRQARSINTKAGLEAALDMRSLDPGVPVLFLTASNDEDIEASALELPGAGKTSFTRKPCGMKAFQLRARQMGRHYLIPFGPRAVINKNTHEVTITGEKAPRHLSPQVLDLALVFDRNKGVAMNRLQLVNQWGWDEGSLEQCINVLRQAVGDTDRKRPVIATIRGTGYLYNPPAA